MTDAEFEKLVDAVEVIARSLTNGRSSAYRHADLDAVRQRVLDAYAEVVREQAECDRINYEHHEHCRKLEVELAAALKERDQANTIASDSKFQNDRLVSRIKELESQRDIGLSLLLDGEYQRLKLENRQLQSELAASKAEVERLKAAIRDKAHGYFDDPSICNWRTGVERLPRTINCTLENCIWLQAKGGI